MKRSRARPSYPARVTDDVTRIGRGVPIPAQPEQPTVSPRRRQPLLIALAAVFVGVGVVAGLFFTGVIGRGGTAAPPPQVPMPAPSSASLRVLDEQATCVLLVPAATDAGHLTLAVVSDPNKADWAKVQKTYDNLTLIAAMSSPELRDDANQIAAMLSQLLSLSRTGGKMTFDMSDFKSAGLRIGARCAKYAS